MLWLYGNQLTGPLPPELGTLTNLQRLYLDHNLFTGPLPLSLTNLTALERFWFNDTDLCEPTDPAFQAWLVGIPEVQSTGVRCAPAPVCDTIARFLTRCGRSRLLAVVTADPPLPSDTVLTLGVDGELQQPLSITRRGLGWGVVRDLAAGAHTVTLDACPDLAHEVTCR